MKNYAFHLGAVPVRPEVNVSDDATKPTIPKHKMTLFDSYSKQIFYFYHAVKVKNMFRIIF